MKSTVLFLFIALMTVNFAFAQRIAAKKVPSPIITAFNGKYPDVTKVKWELEKDDHYEAEIKQNGEEQSVIFDKQGDWVETETELKATQLPEPVKQSISQQFPDFRIDEAEKSETHEKGVVYEVEVEKAKTSYKLIISPSGEILKKEKEDGRRKK
jgi:hypothetical protein